MASKFSFFFVGIGIAAAIGIVSFVLLSDSEFLSADQKQTTPPKVEYLGKAPNPKIGDIKPRLVELKERGPGNEKLKDVAIQTRPLEVTLSNGEAESVRWIVGYFGDGAKILNFHSDSDLIKFPEGVEVNEQWAVIEFVVEVPEDYPKGQEEIFIYAGTEGDPGMVKINVQLRDKVLLNVI